MDKKKASGPNIVKETGWTVEDYYQLPEDGNQYEIIRGQLELKPSPTTTHQRMSQRLEFMLIGSCENEFIIMDAPVDVILSENETRQPDILMIHRNREDIIKEYAVVGPPDLVIEILSPTSAKRDRTVKKESYAQFGVTEYWIADPFNLTIEQYVLTSQNMPYDLLHVFGADDTVTSKHLPCVSFIVKEVLKL
ncbi:Uma2 family endonuclease [Scopulibacillus darangshiensis]|uniref:Uma2 family endonuclease n=1 Tax=Scopulibacillus darangshiensis TaxID=442528 RepID=A0A4R2P9R8_9BACL|nr:Uma2 family endonuclease [Scopulibacillus darangshiensis]TCP31783.1 Uma2 family endonuclease [Scopulibacillus darangshiensis]